MPASMELHSPDEYSVVVTLDIDNCSTAAIPVAELYDFRTSTVAEDYLEVLQSYVMQQLAWTPWLDKRVSARLLNAGFAT
jgi:hypothetical protein